MWHAAVLVRGPASLPQNVRRDQPEHSPPPETERTTSSTAWQENFAVTRSEHIMRVTDVPTPVPASGGSSSSCVACA